MSADSRDAAAPRPIRIVVVDDHTLFRRGITALLSRVAGFEVVGEAADGFDGIKAVALHRPDVVLLDLNMPGISGIDALHAILKEAPGTHIVMLTVSEDADDLMLALRAGAQGYLLKNIESDFLVDAVRRAADGESVMSPEMTAKLMREVRTGGTAAAHAEALHLRREDGERTIHRPHGGVPLSPREREILLRIARGESNKEVGRELGVAESTVKIHVQHILRKLKLTSRVQAAVYAAEHGLLPRDA
jgi:two-component system nitrate/nitrite response regulator NarL